MELASHQRRIQRVALTALAVICTTADSATAQQQLAKLLASDGAKEDFFASSVAISGDLALVGSLFDDDAGTSSGSAYVFDVATGEQKRKLVASDASPWDLFGFSVAISGQRAIVGARTADAAGQDSGAAYVFDAGTGQQLFKLVPASLAAHDEFGYTVAISGQRAVVGAPGHVGQGTTGVAWLFDAATGQELFELLAWPPGEGLGGIVAISGERVVVGTPGADVPGNNAGAAYVFDATTGFGLFVLRPSDLAAGDLFGASVAASDGVALVGARMHGPHGAAYLFDLATGQELFELSPPDVNAAYSFGEAVALSDGRAVVGDLGADGPSSVTGAAYVFDVATGQFLYELTALDGSLGDFFGDSVAISGARALIGARGDDDNGDDSGSAYLFAVPQSAGSAYCFGDGSGTTCACGNTAGPGQGCANSTGAGAILWAAGSASASADELVLYADNVIPGQAALAFAALNAVHDGDGWPLSDGLRCAGGGAVRLGISLPGPDATGIWGAGLAEQAGVVPGDLRRFQVWYRDPSGGPCGTGANLTNGLEVTFTP